jgi:hypothetical protein
VEGGQSADWSGSKMGPFMIDRLVGIAEESGQPFDWINTSKCIRSDKAFSGHHTDLDLSRQTIHGASQVREPELVDHGNSRCRLRASPDSVGIFQ